MHNYSYPTCSLPPPPPSPSQLAFTVLVMVFLMHTGLAVGFKVGSINPNL